MRADGVFLAVACRYFMGLIVSTDGFSIKHYPTGLARGIECIGDIMMRQKNVSKALS